VAGQNAFAPEVGVDPNPCKASAGSRVAEFPPPEARRADDASVVGVPVDGPKENAIPRVLVFARRVLREIVLFSVEQNPDRGRIRE
jgi:hypothetical protein